MCVCVCLLPKGMKDFWPLVCCLFAVVFYPDVISSSPGYGSPCRRCGPLSKGPFGQGAIIVGGERQNKMSQFAPVPGFQTLNNRGVSTGARMVFNKKEVGNKREFELNEHALVA